MTDDSLPLTGASYQMLQAPTPLWQRQTMVSDMQDPEAWVLSSRAGSIQPDTSTYARGTQSLAFSTTGDPSRPTFADLALPGADMTDSQWDLWLRAEDYRQIDGVWLELGEDDDNYIRLDATPDVRTLRTGTWCRVTVNRASTRSVTGRPSLARITRVRVRVNPAARSVASRVWLGYVGLIPTTDSGVVSVAFDDGYNSDYDTARVIMQRHGIPTGTSYIIADKVGKPGRMTLDQLVEMRDIHNWEIAAHASTDLTTLDEAGVRSEFTTIRSFLIDHGYRASANHFALPMGRYNELVLRVARDYFDSVRTIDVAQETVTPGDPFRLRVFYCGSYTTEIQVARALAQCKEYASWMHMVFHRVDATPDGAPESVSADNFERFMGHLADSGLPVKKISEIIRGD